MYRRRVGAGEVLYLALGHCNPVGILTRGEAVGERRGSWQSPVFRELVRRGIDWAMHPWDPLAPLGEGQGEGGRVQGR